MARPFTERGSMRGWVIFCLPVLLAASLFAQAPSGPTTTKPAPNSAPQPSTQFSSPVDAMHGYIGMIKDHHLIKAIETCWDFERAVASIFADAQMSPEQKRQCASLLSESIKPTFTSEVQEAMALADYSGFTSQQLTDELCVVTVHMHAQFEDKPPLDNTMRYYLWLGPAGWKIYDVRMNGQSPFEPLKKGDLQSGAIML